MRESIILYDTEEFKNTGCIVALKFLCKSTRSFDRIQLKEFKEVLFGHIYTNNIYKLNDLLKLKYNNIRTISNQLMFINTELDESITIEDIKRASSCTYNQSIQKSIFNTNDEISTIIYIKDKDSKKTYSEERALMSHLSKHIHKYRPLCVYEKNLLDKIKEKEKNDYQNFLKKAVLEEQKLEKHNKLIKDLLDEYQIDIIDFNWIV